MTSHIELGPVRIGPDQPLAVVAGPCSLEDHEINLEIGRRLKEHCGLHGFTYLFKGSFDKANRSSITSHRGPGLRPGLEELARLRQELDVPVTTDIHLPEQASDVAAVVDLLQIPAFLCRQTDLLLAAADTGRPVNVKKGQFLAPTEMRHVVTKLRDGGCRQIMLTERGTFFGYHRLVNDFIGLRDMIDLCFDVTHSTQLPGSEREMTGGRPDRAALLARAAVVSGVHAVFVECHPQPDLASSDRTTMQSLDAMESMLDELAALHRTMQQLASRDQPHGASKEAPQCSSPL